MGASSNNNHRASSLAREASLRRSFVAIHRSHSPPTNFEDSMPIRLSPDVGPHVNVNDEHEALRRRSSNSTGSILRRSSFAITSLQHSPSGPALLTPPFSGRHMPELPFKCEHRNKKIQRRSSAITADDAHRMFIKLTNANEKRRHERRRSMDYKLRRQNSASPPPKQQRRAPKELHHGGFRQDYMLGETLRSPSHVIIPKPTSIEAISAVQKHDFVFIKRSNGSFTYAILAFRSEPSVDSVTEETMTFVIDGIGSTKAIRRQHWNDFVRFVSMEGILDRRPSASSTSTRRPTLACTLKTRSQSPTSPIEHVAQEKNVTPRFPTTPAVVCREIGIIQEEENYEADFVVPNMIISFDKIRAMEDECSLISSVSDRARGC